LRVLDPNPGEQRSLQCDLLDAARFVCGAFFVDGGPAIKDHGLHVVSATDGSEIKQLTDTPDGCNDLDVVPSPDRTSVAFTRVCGPNDEIGTVYRVGIDGHGLLALSPSDVSEHESSFGKPNVAWSPDGSQIAYGPYIASASSTALFLVRADGTDVRQVVSTEIGAATAAWSPDGKWIAFTSRYRSQPQVWLVRPDGTGLVKLTDGSDGSVSVGPVWSPDGTSLLFARGRGVADGIVAGAASLWTMSADGTNQKQLIALPNPESTGGYAWGGPPAE
jgi:Tol biopolymer transport system component